MNDLKNIYRFCGLLKREYIKNEMSEILKGFELNHVNFMDEELMFLYSDKTGNLLNLKIDNEKVDVVKLGDKRVEIIKLSSLFDISHFIVEKYENGIIYSEIRKIFLPGRPYFDDFILSSLVEDRFVFTSSSLEKVIDNEDFDHNSLYATLMYLKRQGSNELDRFCDLYSTFSTHVADYPQYLNKFDECFYPTKTYLNGEDLSHLFDIGITSDILYRAFDIYNGIANDNNKYISPRAFNLRKLKGITEEEMILIGNSKDSDKVKVIK